MNLTQALADVATARRVEIETRKLVLHKLSGLRSEAMRELEAMPEQYRANAAVLANEAFSFAEGDIESKFEDIASSLPSDDTVEENFEEDVYLERGEHVMQAAE